MGTPLLAGSCRVTRALRAGRNYHYHVPCPHCGQLHPLEPENLIASVEAEDVRPKEAHFRCPNYDGRIEQRHRAWMVDPANGAEWVAHNREAPDYSFTIWAAYAGSKAGRRSPAAGSTPRATRRPSRCGGTTLRVGPTNRP